MHKILFLSMQYEYKACNPAILNLSIVKEKISLGLLDYRPKLLISTVLGLLFVCVFFLLLVRVFWLLCVFYLVGWEVGFTHYVHMRTFILDNMILYEKKISIVIVIANLEGFIRTI